MSIANMSVLLSLSLTAKTLAAVIEPPSVQSSLMKWQENQKVFMSEGVEKWKTNTPQKTDKSNSPTKIGRNIDGAKTMRNSDLILEKFSKESVRNDGTDNVRDDGKNQNRKFLEHRYMIREKIMHGNRLYDKAAPDLSNDDPADFVVGGIRTKNIYELNQPELLTARSQTIPWSGDFWATQNGGIGARYADEEFPSSKNWKENFDYITKLTYKDLIRPGLLQNPDHLSPAEKYDLITSSDGALTQYAWQEGKDYFERYGEVESWFGICHGWAIASFMEKRPKAAIEVPVQMPPLDESNEPQATTIRLNPADIKGLISQMWANGSFATRFLGGRCDIKEPVVDDETGRLLEKDCFDVNPMSWHLAITHEIGFQRTPFVIDASEDYEVWNQPAYEYKITYFNPISASETSDISKAIVPYKDWKKDPFKKWRKAGVHSLIGIAMDVTYRVETLATQTIIDDPGQDRSNTVRYLYDLELDKNGNLIGGEWYQRQHPDFAWSASSESFPVSVGDFEIENLDWKPLSETMPKAWEDNIIKASKNGSIPRSILEKMIEASANQELPAPIE